MADDLLPPTVLRQISDKLYEKRKAAALEVEQIVKRLAAAGDHGRVRLLVDKLVSEYAFTPQPNHRKGALLCLAAAAVGLGTPSADQLRLIVPPVLASFKDTDARVRYYACEALYNVAKVARESFLQFFNDVFEALFKLCADPEVNVQNAVTFLDNLVKDIVAASPASFNMPAFVPRLRALLAAPVSAPKCRAFLISWITVLDSVPDLDLLSHLPALLEGLLGCLGDGAREIRVAAHKALMEFLVEVQASRCVDFGGMAVTLVGAAGSGDEFTRLTALKWLREFVALAPGQLVASYPAILAASLANLSHPNPDIAEVSKQASDALLNAAPTGTDGTLGGLALDTRAMLCAISCELTGTPPPPGLIPGVGDPSAPPPAYAALGPGGALRVAGGGGGGEAGRLEALRWVMWLLAHAQGAVMEALPGLLPALLDALMSQSEAVADAALRVFSAIAAVPGRFRPALAALLDRFRGEGGGLMLQRGGALVIRRLCGCLGPEPVFRELAAALAEEGDLAFAATMVQALNLILLTSPELRELREALMAASQPPSTTQPPPTTDLPTAQPPAASGDGGDWASSPPNTAASAAAAATAPCNPNAQRGASLFVALYPCWAHAPGALLSLCLLSHAYGHTHDVVQCYRWLPIGAEVLVQMDRLVQLLDSPPFTPLRLALLAPREHPHLTRALYALLALLPQGNAFRLLSTRLQSVPTHALLALEGLAPATDLRVSATAAAASAPPPLTPTFPITPQLGAPYTSAEAHSNLSDQAQQESGAPNAWDAIDWAGLLRVFCARQQRHYAVEVGGTDGGTSAPTATGSTVGAGPSVAVTTAAAAGAVTDVTAPPGNTTTATATIGVDVAGGGASAMGHASSGGLGAGVGEVGGQGAEGGVFPQRHSDAGDGNGGGAE